MGNITNAERARRREAQREMQNMVTGVALIMLLMPLIIGAVKLLVTFILLPFRHPKIGLPVHLAIAVVACMVFAWYHSPTQQHKRAQALLASRQYYSEGDALLKKAADKDYCPAVLQYADIRYRKHNYAEAYKYYSRAASLNDPNGWYWKGVCLENAHGTVRDLTEANACYAKAHALGLNIADQAKRRTDVIAKYWKDAHGGNPAAEYNLAICYARGDGIGKDEKIAREWLLKSANRGFPKAQVMLCNWLIAGKGGPKNVSLGVSYCNKAANQNYVEAYAMLGHIFFFGIGGVQNYSTALENYLKAAERNSADGAFSAGYCYKTGCGTAADNRRAFELFKQSAERKYAPAAYCLAECYENGTGTEINYTQALRHYALSAKTRWSNRVIKKTNADSAKGESRLSEIGRWWELADKHHDPRAQCRVGVCFFSGRGVTQNYEKALQWFERSAKQGYTEAVVRIADCQFNGYGMAKDERKAVSVYMAQSKKSPLATLRLAQCYEDGLGMEQDITKAYELYSSIPSKTGSDLERLRKLKEVAEYWSLAHKNDPVAQYRLALCYLDGGTIKPNTDKALSWMTKSADSGCSDAQYDLSQIYIKRDDAEARKKAIALLARASKQGNVNAQIRLGEYYYNGIEISEDYKKAIALWEDAAKKSNADALFLLANHHFSGKGFFNSGKDIDKAIGLWSDAARLGHAASAYKLYIYYRDGVGLTGSGKNRRMELRYLQQAAMGNIPDAMYAYGKHLIKTRQPEAGVDFLKRAANAGSKDAAAYMKRKHIL